VIKLRNHPSIAYWVGNNEINEGWNNWGWQSENNGTVNNLIYNWYSQIFDQIIPEILDKYDPLR
jgi:beta-mannosidase